MTPHNKEYPIDTDQIERTLARDQKRKIEDQTIYEADLPGGLHFTARLGIPFVLGGSVVLLSACGFDLNRSYDDQFRDNTATPGSPSRRTTATPSSPGQQLSPGQNTGCRAADGIYYENQTPTGWTLEECVRDDNRKLDTSIWRRGQINAGVAWDGKSRRRVEPINVSKMTHDTETYPLQDGIIMSCYRNIQSCKLVDTKKSSETPKPTQVPSTESPQPAPTDMPTALARVETVPSALTGSMGVPRSSESDSTQPDLSVFIPPSILAVVVLPLTALVMATKGGKIVEKIRNRRARGENTNSSEIVSARRAKRDRDGSIIVYEPKTQSKNPSAQAVPDNTS